MLVSEIILSTRSILRDDGDKQRFSDGELKEHILHCTNKLISQFAQNIHHAKLKIASNPFELPFKAAVIHQLKLNGKPIRFGSLAYALQSSELVFYNCSGNVYAIHNFNAQDFELEILASAFVDNADDFLPLDILFRRALALATSIEMMSIETRADSLQRQVAYQAQLEKELNELRAMLSKASTPASLETKHIL